MVIHILFVLCGFACLLFLCNILKVCLCTLYLFLSRTQVSVTIIVYGHTHIVCFVWFCLFVVFMQYFKSLSVPLVSLPLDAEVSVTIIVYGHTHFVCFVFLLVCCFYAKSKKLVYVSCISSSVGRMFL